MESGRVEEVEESTECREVPESFESGSRRVHSPAIISIRAAEICDESTEHVGEVLIQARNIDFFVARDVLSLPSDRQVSARFQRRAAGDHEIVGEVAIGALPDSPDSPDS